MRASLLVVALLALALGFGDVERGNRLYRAGHYGEAVEAYRAALADGHDTPELRYNLGTALLRIGAFEEAQEHLRAAVASVDPELLFRATYNLGTAYLMAGRAESEPGPRRLYLDAAVETLKDALRLEPGDMDAKWNLELALRFLENTEPPEEEERGDDDGGDGDRGEPPEGGDQQVGSPSGGQQQADDGPLPELAPLTPEEAERILNAAEQSERDVVRARLGRESRDTPVVRDW